jgi:hypothetical protein
VVEAKYRFEGYWDVGDRVGVDGAIVVLDANTFTVTGGGVNISFTGVHTEGGGTYDPDWWYIGAGTWAYLYTSSGKIGIVAIISNGNRMVGLGKSWLEGVRNGTYYDAGRPAFESMGYDTTDMQDTHNGLAWMPG